MLAKKTALTVLALGVATIAGCPLTDSRTSNQGGGILLLAGGKVLAGNLTQLNPDEIQLLADEVDRLSQDFSAEPLTDDQAAAIVDFIDQNGLNTIAAVEEKINNPQGVVIPESLGTLIAAGDLPTIQRTQP